MQFPYAASLYALFFIAPLALVALSCVFALRRLDTGPIVLLGLLFYLAFTVRWINTSYYQAEDHNDQSHQETGINEQTGHRKIRYADGRATGAPGSVTAGCSQ